MLILNLYETTDFKLTSIQSIIILTFITGGMTWAKVFTKLLIL